MLQANASAHPPGDALARRKGPGSRSGPMSAVNAPREMAAAAIAADASRLGHNGQPCIFQSRGAFALRPAMTALTA